MSHISLNLCGTAGRSHLTVENSRPKTRLPDGVIILIANLCLFPETEPENKAKAETRDTREMGSASAYKFSAISAFSRISIRNMFHQMRILQGFVETDMTTTKIIKDRVNSLQAQFAKSIGELGAYPLHQMIDFKDGGEMIAFASTLNSSSLRECRGLESGGHLFNPIGYAIYKKQWLAAIRLMRCGSHQHNYKELITGYFRYYFDIHRKNLTIETIRLFVENGADPNCIIWNLMTDLNPLFEPCIRLPGIDLNSIRHPRGLEQTLFSTFFYHSSFYALEEGKKCIFGLLNAGGDICKLHFIPDKYKDETFEHACHLRTSDKHHVLFHALKMGASSTCIVKLISQCPEISWSLRHGEKTICDYYSNGCPPEITRAINERVAMTSADNAIISAITWRESLNAGECYLWK